MVNLNICNQKAKKNIDSKRDFTISNKQNDELQTFYKKQASIYDTVRSSILDSFDEKIALLKKVGNLSNESKVVEIGVGTGKYLSKIVKDTGCYGVGIDINIGMLLIANGTKRCKVTYIQSDAERLPLKPGTLDVAFAVNSIHQIKNLKTAFLEFFKILKPGGKLLIIMPEIYKLQDFLLYKACPFLFDFEKGRMPTRDLLELYGIYAGFTNLKYIAPPQNNNTIPLEQFLFCIKHKFLTCLALLNTREIEDVLRRVKSLAVLNGISQVYPYEYMIVIFEKQEE